MSNRGLFIVIDGTDDVVNSEHFLRIIDRLRSNNYDVVSIDFPRYDKPSSYFLKQYQAGHYGSINDISPYSGSIFFSMDRFASSAEIKKALSEGKIVVVNRFTGRDMVQQGARLSYSEERRGYFIWLDNLEFEILKIPRPDLNIVLRISSEAIKNPSLAIKEQQDQSYVSPIRSAHSQFVSVYDDLCQLFPKDFTRIDCVRNNQMLSSDAIEHLVWERIQPLLPFNPPANKTEEPEASVAINQVLQGTIYIIKADGKYKITEQGKHLLGKVLSSPESDLYLLKNNIELLVKEESIRRFMTSNNNLKTTILEEYNDLSTKKAVNLADNSEGGERDEVNVVSEHSSQLVIEKIKNIDSVILLEQAQKYIPNSYYTPKVFDTKTSQLYKQNIDKLLQLNAQVFNKLCEFYKISPKSTDPKESVIFNSALAFELSSKVLPIAVSSSLIMNTTKESIQSVIRKLSDSNLDELNELGTRTADELSKLYPELQKLVHKTDLVNASKLPKLSEENYSDDNPPISLIYYSPKNELELTADIIYESSNLSLQELREVTSSWSYDKKAKILSTYCDQFTANKMRSRGALDKTQYTWDVISDYATFRDFQENPAFTVVARQPLNTRFGYSLPQDIDDAGLSDLYDQCFDISLSLHSELIQSNYINDAEYATLIGHKLRYQVTNNAESLLFNASHTTDRQRLNIEYDNLLREMVEMVTEVHPLIGASLKASNNNRQFSKSKSLGR